MAQKTDNNKDKIIEAIRAATQAPRGLTAELIALRDKFAANAPGVPNWFEANFEWDGEMRSHAERKQIMEGVWPWHYADLRLAGRGDVSSERGETKQAALADMAEGLYWALGYFAEVAKETRDGCAVLGSESRTGKLLRAMAGQLRGHRQDIDTIHDILDRARDAVARGEQL